MPSRSAGILLHRRGAHGPEVLLVHPGGPFWAGRDDGAWSIPKGEYAPDEEPLVAARREFAEELGGPVPSGPEHDLGEIRQRSGKLVRAFAIAGDFDAANTPRNTCEVVWPPRSGRTIVVPEVDEARWLALDEAREKINPAQRELIARLETLLADRHGGGRSAERTGPVG